MKTKTNEPRKCFAVFYGDEDEDRDGCARIVFAPDNESARVAVMEASPWATWAHAESLKSLAGTLAEAASSTEDEADAEMVQHLTDFYADEGEDFVGERIASFRATVSGIR